MLIALWNMHVYTMVWAQWIATNMRVAMIIIKIYYIKRALIARMTLFI